MNRPVTIAAVGAGHRSVLYSEYAIRHPDRMKVVAVAEPNPVRRQAMAQRHRIPPEMQFESYEALAARPALADAVINGTMDHLHHRSSVPLLKAGYHLLLEKPIATSDAHVRDLIRVAAEHQRIVMICHVLRYAPFYQQIKRMLVEGRIGRIISLRTTECVSYHHMATAFVRGRWNREEASNPMLLAKCCHDLDIISWLMSGDAVRQVASFGSLVQFRPENAPPGSAKRCLDGCQIESTCPYSARTNYITQNLWGFYAWEPIEHIAEPTVEQKLESLRRDNPYGRCVWHCDNDVVDHQNVIIEFASGATATHEMHCGTARATRTIHIVGTNGEIEGDMAAGMLKLRTFDGSPEKTYCEEAIDLTQQYEASDSHGGGDYRLVADFIAVLRGESASLGVTRIEDSLAGHAIAFAAEDSRKNRRVVSMQ